MTTPYVEALALVSRNNEAIDEVILITEETDGIVSPMDLTGRSFFGQARVAKSFASNLICNLEVSVYGDPLLGQLRIQVSDQVMSGLSPIKGHYDILTRSGLGTIDNIYMAPFVVEGGVSKWL